VGVGVPKVMCPKGWFVGSVTRPRGEGGERGGGKRAKKKDLGGDGEKIEKRIGTNIRPGGDGVGE